MNYKFYSFQADLNSFGRHVKLILEFGKVRKINRGAAEKSVFKSGLAPANI
jgi:hypothetical protein